MQGGLTLDPALVERFIRDWKALTGAGVADRALIALSGGPDSAALLLLFAAIRGSLNPPIAATVDHGIRAASSAEAGLAADLCRALGVPHTILKGELPDRSGPTANLSARARDLRYGLLRAHAEANGARWIVTAHHADDQLETLIMRLNRGSGVGGLAGIRGLADPVVRPLLGWSRAELAGLVTAAGVNAVNDPSNVDARFDRARLRKNLQGAEWLDMRAAARSAAALAEADEALEWAVDRLQAETCHFGEGQSIFESFLVPPELQRRLVERCLRHIDPGINIRGDDLTRLLAKLRRCDPATLGRVRCGVVMMHYAEAWSFQTAPPRQRGTTLAGPGN